VGRPVRLSRGSREPIVWPMRRGAPALIAMALLVGACSPAGEPATTSRVPGGTTTLTPGTWATGGTTTTLAGRPMLGEGPENPMPVGEGHVVGGWDIAVRPHGADRPLGMFANLDGALLVAVRVAARWTGDLDPSPVLSDVVRFLALGVDGSEVGAETGRCPDPLPLTGPGPLAEGNVCFELPLSAVDQIQLIAEEFGEAAPHRAYLATDVSPQMHCSTGACSLRYLQGPELTREEFLATDIGQTLESTFIGGDAEAENNAYVAAEGFSIVSDSLVLGYRRGRPVFGFELEGGRVVSWGSGGGSARLSSGDLLAARWQPVTPLDSEAITVPIQVPGGACVTENGSEVVTQVRSVEVVEDASSVRVVVWTYDRQWPGLCAGLGITLDAEVPLAAPLGERVLIDAGGFPAENKSLQCPIREESLPDQDLPEAVAATREAIYLAALYCDWAALEELAIEAGGIEYGDGAVGWVGDPVPFWRDAMGGIREGKHPLWYLAGALELSPVAVEGDGGEILFYGWPGVAYKGNPTQADWDELRALYSEETIEAFRSGGEGYAGGFVVYIGPDGTWLGALIMSV